MADEYRPRPVKHTFKLTATPVNEFLQVEEWTGSFERYDNTMSDEQNLLVMNRGDSVAALLYDETNSEVLLVEQFRLPATVRGASDGWIVEPAAGKINANESPLAAIIRELQEETGYHVTDLSEIATFFVSPGGSSERIYLYFADVRRRQKVGSGEGNRSEGENIRTIPMQVDQFFAKLRTSEFEDAKLIIAGLWLRERLATRPVDDFTRPITVERKVKSGSGEKVIGYKAGHIKSISGIDAWVNPVSTDMMLDRFTDRTVSAAIRRLGAHKSTSEHNQATAQATIERDTIGDALRAAMANRTFVAPAKVIVTDPGVLAGTHKVVQIFHVATAKGEISESNDDIRFDLSFDRDKLELCIDNVLAAVEAARLKSVLIPMIGTGADGFAVNEVAQPLMARVIDYFDNHPKSRIERVYFLGYSMTDADSLDAALRSLSPRLAPPEPDPADRIDDEIRPRPRKHTFTKTARLLDGFFKVDEYKGTYERYDNTQSEVQTRLVFERGDSVAALLYDAANSEVLLVEQFRLPTVASGQSHGWIVEPAAGMIKDDSAEKPATVMIKRLRQEINYQVNDLSEIATFFVSPGGSSERVFLYFAEVRRAQNIGKGDGSDADGKTIRTIHMPVVQFFAKLRNREFEDAKLIIAGQWLRERLATKPVDDFTSPTSFERVIKGGAGRKIIGFKSGHIKTVVGFDAWVNPVSTYMMLDRFTDNTVSAAIRRLGAEKLASGKGIKRDTIGDALRAAMGNRASVDPAEVIVTSAGALERTHKVARLFHVATAQGAMSETKDGLPFDSDLYLANLEKCIDQVLAAVETARLKRVLIPMIGTGADGLAVSEVAKPLVARAIDYFDKNPNSKIERVYFLGYSITDKDSLAAALISLDHRLVPL